jgi:DNA-binding NtrC family response regulator
VGSILLVEADPHTRGSWAAALRGDDHEVMIVKSPREALGMIRDGGIDVVVIDTYDPRVGLMELAKQLEALPDAPPIVLLSASPLAPEVSVRIGAAAFVAKPCDPAEVREVALRLLGNVRPVRRVEASEDDSTEDEPTGPNRVAG